MTTPPPSNATPKRVNRYVWLDLETTGLNPRKGYLLECYTRVTNVAWEPLGEYHALLDVPQQEAWAAMDDYVRNMHTKNGLLEDLRTKPTLNRNAFARELTAFLREHKTNGERLYLAGNTINFDRAWLEVFAPQAVEELYHRNLDVSSTRVQMEARTGEDWHFPKKKGHRAKDDVDESIAEHDFLWDKYDAWVLSR